MWNLGDIVTLAVYFVPIALAVWTLNRRLPPRSGSTWLGALHAANFLIAAALSLDPAARVGGQFGRGFLLVLVLSALVIAFGGLLLRNLNQRVPQVWTLSGLIWLLFLTAVHLIVTGTRVGERGWVSDLFSNPEPVGMLTLFGLAAAGAALIGAAYYAYARAGLPEIANQALLWLLLALAVLAGAALMISGSDLLMIAGAITILAGVTGATYVHQTNRAFDLRLHVLSIVHTIIVIAVLTALIAGAIAAADWLQISRQAQAAGLIVILALLLATLFVPLRQAVEAIFDRLLRDKSIEATTAARKYSQRISGALDLKQLTQTISTTLDEVLDVRRAGLIFVQKSDKADGAVVLRLPGSAGENGRELRGRLAHSSPILHRWTVERAPIRQFDLEVDLIYSAVDPAELAFFRQTGMSAYAPIVVDGALIGVLACGAKRDDSPLFPADLDLLATMADQTGIALRNARLVADLRQLNDEMQVLNRGLEATKEQMEKLDAVKTDFITIASHELRTPLAQIRGYADLVDALNDDGMVDPDRVSSMVDNIRRATQRMEELIGAMLDVSQLDVKAMDLRFTQTSVESILRMAIEPLTDAARQRKLSLAARGLRGLPVIEADMQRLVQAFRNVIVNAIKFTPDGGRIDITAELVTPPDGEGEPHVLVKIADTGVGIDKDDLELIFRKFYRASDPNLHSTGTYKFMGAGPGLGLTIAKGVIEGHGGRIWVESPGHDMEKCPGSTFYIQIPVHPPEDARRVMRFDDAGLHSSDLRERTTEVTHVSAGGHTR